MEQQEEVFLNRNILEKHSATPWFFIYPFFLVHMLMFGGSGFYMAYGMHDPDVVFLYLHGGFAIAVYTIFYRAMFGREQVKWMFINAGLGVMALYSQLGWILAKFGTAIGDYPIHLHVIPLLYFVLYTFLLRQLLLDITRARYNQRRRAIVEFSYVCLSLAAYLWSIV